ncbi:MAG: hypothetical protein Q4G70_02375 [Pseudomonadota bacterium]|nr:hypothetical protein [Pseudomonadota bacterium]
MSTSTQRHAPGQTVAAPEAPAIEPFWHKLNSFFLFPFQTEPLLYALLLSVCSYALLVAPPLIDRFILLGFVLAVARYAFKVAALASRGVLHSRDYTASMNDPDWVSLPWKFVGVLVVHSMIVHFIGQRSEIMGLLVNLLSSLVLPATLMVLIRSCSLRAALNPLELIAAIGDVGKSYWLLCLFLFLLQAGFPQAIGLLAPIAPLWLLPPLLAFGMIYFSWVMAALLGYVMYQHHGALDITPLKDPASTTAAGHPVRNEAQSRDADVAALVQQGNLREAIAQAREWARTGPDSLSDQRRYHRVLLLDDVHSGRLSDHGQRFLAQLLSLQRGPEALEVYGAIATKLPDFAPESAALTLALAQQAWKGGNAAHTTALLKGFDRRYTGTPEVPQAYELIVRVLKQGLSRPDQALRVYQTLQQRYPDHAATQEAAWVLRQELATG